MTAGRRGRVSQVEAEPGPPPGPTLETRNEVSLVGRVAAPAEERTMPSGDTLAVWRLVVDRPAGSRAVPGVRSPTVDTLDCVAWGAGARRTARGLVAGDVISVHGALRRRFWRGGAGAVSRCEVEVQTVKRLARAAAPVRGRVSNRHKGSSAQPDEPSGRKGDGPVPDPP